MSAVLSIIRDVKRCSQCGIEKPLEVFSVGRAECKPCHAARGRAWNNANKERCRENSRRWRLEDPERYRAMHNASQRRLNERDPSKQAARSKKWIAKHPEKVRIYNFSRAARHAAAPGKTSTSQFSSRWSYFGGRCWMCGAEATEMDHVIPLARGGSNWPSNLRPACLPCNRRKWANRVVR